MSESPLEVIQRWQRSPHNSIKDCSFLPGLSNDRIRFLESTRKKPLPALIKELLPVTTGIHFTKDDIYYEIDFETGSTESNLFPDSIHLVNDNCGNSWTVDLAFDPERVGPVFFVCHDPPVIFYQSHDLAEFLDHFLNGKELIAEDHAIWTAGETGGRRDGEWVVFDLQKEELGSGAPLCLYHDEPSGLERVGNSLVFRIRHRTRNWWQRFRDRWR